MKFLHTVKYRYQKTGQCVITISQTTEAHFALFISLRISEMLHGIHISLLPFFLRFSENLRESQRNKKCETHLWSHVNPLLG